MQQEDWSRTKPEPFSVGALLATAALSLQAVVKTTVAAGAPRTGERQVQELQGGRRAAGILVLHRRLP